MRGLMRGTDPPSAAVLVNPAHEDMLPRLRGSMPDSAWAAWRIELRRNGDGIDEVDFGDWLRNGSTPPIPTIVLSAARHRFPPGWDAARPTAIARELHASLAETEGGTLIVATRSGHDIPNDEPDLVRQAIEQAVSIVAAQRRERTVPRDRVSER